MKETFDSLNTEHMKVNKEGMQKYIRAIASKYADLFTSHVSVSDQCFDEVWYEIDKCDTGFITWHQVKPFLERLTVHADELAEDIRVAETLRDEHIERKRVAREEKERLDAERRLAEEAEDEMEEK